MTFGVGIISLLLLVNNGIQQKLERNLKGIDMVVGAKGSPLQLILSSVYHIDNPTGNISYKEANKLKSNPMVKLTVPLSYGDSYKGFRIVGTSLDYPDLFQAKIKEGKLWSQSLEVVLGNFVAEVNNLQIGDTFVGSHGLVDGGHTHDEHPYTVVGIFEESNSTIDQLILTNTESVWNVHNHEVDDHECDGNHDHDHHECDGNHDHHHDHSHIDDDAMITAMLVKFKSPVGLLRIPRKINEDTNLQAAVPSFEINRLISLLGFGVQTINLIAIIIIIVSGLSIFISLFNSLKKRRYELALMRVHGATKWQLVKLVLLEGVFISIIGSIFGVLISRTVLFSMSFFFSNSLSSIPLDFVVEELWLFPVSILIGLLASLIPTIQTYNINIPKILSNE
jgi:putative ABC transport system permease protein